MSIIECPHCGNRVLPKEGFCPACSEEVSGAEGQGQPEPSRKQRFQKAEPYIKQWLMEGRSQDAIQQQLAGCGLGTAEAQQFTYKVAASFAEREHAAGAKDLNVGLAWLIGGGAVTGVTYLAVSEAGGTYLVAWGAMAWGALKTFFAMQRQRAAKRMVAARP